MQAPMPRSLPPEPPDELEDDLPTEVVEHRGTGIMLLDDAAGPAPLASLAKMELPEPKALSEALPPPPAVAEAADAGWRQATPVEPTPAEEARPEDARGARFRPAAATPLPVTRQTSRAARWRQEWPVLVIGLSLGFLLAAALWWLRYG